jgi:putative acetyltransferase
MAVAPPKWVFAICAKKIGIGTSMAKDDISLHLEDPRNDDGAILVQELHAIREDLYPDEDHDEYPPPWNDADIATAFLVARIGGIAGGCSAIAPLETKGAFEVVRMYVRPAYRGLCLGDRMLDALGGLARRRGGQVLMLRCGPRQPAAVKLYQRSGFLRRGPFEYYPEQPLNLFFEKKLTTDGG